MMFVIVGVSQVSILGCILHSSFVNNLPSPIHNKYYCSIQMTLLLTACYLILTFRVLNSFHLFFFHRAQCSFENQCSTNPVLIEKEHIVMKIVSAVLGGGLMTLSSYARDSTVYKVYHS